MNRAGRGRKRNSHQGVGDIFARSGSMLTEFVLVSSLLMGQADTKPAEKPAGDKPAAAAPVADAELAKKVAALVKQLDSNQQAQRESAEKELVALGPDVLPLLPALNPRTPAEV